MTIVDEFKARALDVWQNEMGINFDKSWRSKNTPDYEDLPEDEFKVMDKIGGEDQGNHFAIVFEWKDTYIMATGNYQSEYGVDGSMVVYILLNQHK